MAGGEEQRTHLAVSPELVGEVEQIEAGESSRVALTLSSSMRVDEKGLVHGGFTFGLADYAAMVAVNDPHVVLLSSQVKFLKPAVVGDRLTARARVVSREGRRWKVWCGVFRGEEKVLEGEFLCLVLGRHVLEK